MSSKLEAILSCAQLSTAEEISACGIALEACEKLSKFCNEDCPPVFTYVSDEAGMKEFFTRDACFNNAAGMVRLFGPFVRVLDVAPLNLSTFHGDFAQKDGWNNVIEVPSFHNTNLLKTNVEIQGIQCKAETYVKYHEHGSLYKATLANDQNIQGIKCAGKTEVEFFGVGILHACTLLENQDIQGIKCAKGARVQFSLGGKLVNATLSEDQYISGVECGRGAEVWLNDYLQTLDRIVLSKDQEIQGFRFIKGTWVWFYEDGMLHAVMFSQDYELRNIRVPKGAHIVFDKEGKSGNIILHPGYCEAGDSFYFNKNGMFILRF